MESTIDLFRWGQHADSRGNGRRKALQLYLDTRWGVSLSWHEQCKLKDTWDTNVASGVGVSLTRHFGIGHDHGWYDGPHCFFDVGFLHLMWHNQNCRRCLE